MKPPIARCRRAYVQRHRPSTCLSPPLHALKKGGQPRPSRKSEEPPAPTGGCFSDGSNEPPTGQVGVTILPGRTACNASVDDARPLTALRQQPTCPRTRPVCQVTRQRRPPCRPR